MWEVLAAGINLILRPHMTFHEMLTNVFLFQMGQQWHETTHTCCINELILLLTGVKESSSLHGWGCPKAVSGGFPVPGKFSLAFASVYVIVDVFIKYCESCFRRFLSLPSLFFQCCPFMRKMSTYTKRYILRWKVIEERIIPNIQTRESETCKSDREIQNICNIKELAREMAHILLAKDLSSISSTHIR